MKNKPYLKIKMVDIESINFDFRMKPEGLGKIIQCDCFICEELRDYCVIKGLIKL